MVSKQVTKVRIPRVKPLAAVSLTYLPEHYCQSLGSLVVALSDQPELLRQIVEYVISLDSFVHIHTLLPGHT